VGGFVQNAEVLLQGVAIADSSFSRRWRRPGRQVHRG